MTRFCLGTVNSFQAPPLWVGMCDKTRQGRALRQGILVSPAQKQVKLGRRTICFRCPQSGWHTEARRLVGNRRTRRARGRASPHLAAGKFCLGLHRALAGSRRLCCGARCSPSNWPLDWCLISELGVASVVTCLEAASNFCMMGCHDSRFSLHCGSRRLSKDSATGNALQLDMLLSVKGFLGVSWNDVILCA